MPEATRSPGRPRSPAADDAIVQATLELLVEVGYRSLTMEQVRARSGVGKATIYRRYANKAELVRAAIAHLHQDLDTPADTGSFPGDLGEVMWAVVGAAVETGAGHVIPRLLADAADDPELKQLFYDNLVAPRRQLMRITLERGIERGELRDDLDLEVVMDMLVGPVVYRGMLSGMDPMALAERARTILDTLLVGISRR